MAINPNDDEILVVRKVLVRIFIVLSVPACVAFIWVAIHNIDGDPHLKFEIDSLEFKSENNTSNKNSLDLNVALTLSVENKEATLLDSLSVVVAGTKNDNDSNDLALTQIEPFYYGGHNQRKALHTGAVVSITNDSFRDYFSKKEFSSTVIVRGNLWSLKGDNQRYSITVFCDRIRVRVANAYTGSMVDAPLPCKFTFTID